MTDPFAHAAGGFRFASAGFRILVFTLAGGLVVGVAGRFLIEALFGLNPGDARSLVEFAMFLLAGLTVAALVVTLMGRGKALAAPGVSRARQAWGAGALSLGGFAFLVALAGLASIVLEVRNREVRRGLFVVALVLWGFGELFFLLFAKGVAEALRRADLAGEASGAFRAGMWTVILVATGTVFADDFRIPGAALVVFGVVFSLSALGRYQRVLSGLAAALGNPADDVLIGFDDPDDDPGW